VHVVTVPQRRLSAGQEPDLLWGRFCAAFGVDPAWGPRESERTNPSLGVAETQLLRKLNRRMDRVTRRQSSYDDLIRGMLAQDELLGRKSEPVRLPPEMYPWAELQSERWIEWIEASGVDVVGDVEDLRPVPPPEDQPFKHPDKVPPRLQLNAALDALAAMTREAARRPDPEQKLVRRIRTQAERLRDQ
jgi:hypothetical protein